MDFSGTTKNAVCVFTLGMMTLSASAQTSTNDTSRVAKLEKALSRFHIGGYGEVALSRNFYSDNVSRYSLPDEHKDDPSHGRFDIPHAVVYLGYDFGKGWSLSTEIEFEHGGTGFWVW